MRDPQSIPATGGRLVLCRPDWTVVAVVELDDASHRRADRQHADERQRKAVEHHPDVMESLQKPNTAASMADYFSSHTQYDDCRIRRFDPSQDTQGTT